MARKGIRCRVSGVCGVSLGRHSPDTRYPTPARASARADTVSNDVRNLLHHLRRVLPERLVHAEEDLQGEVVEEEAAGQEECGHGRDAGAEAGGDVVGGALLLEVAGETVG